MKKKLLRGLAVLAIVAVAAWGGGLNLQKGAFAQEVLENELELEADGKKLKSCFNSITATPGHLVHYCPSGCTNWTPGESTWYSGTCN